MIEAYSLSASILYHFLHITSAKSNPAVFTPEPADPENPIETLIIIRYKLKILIIYNIKKSSQKQDELTVSNTFRYDLLGLM
jgi:hypothetical protein